MGFYALIWYTGGQVTWDCLRDNAQKFFQETRRHYLTQQSACPPPLVLALDEAHVMAQRDAPVPSLLDIFCSVMADMKEWEQGMHFACIFLSTNSQLNNVAPTVGQIISERASTQQLAGALTCVPFDVFVERNRRWTVAKISTLSFLGLFGRPL